MGRRWSRGAGGGSRARGPLRGSRAGRSGPVQRPPGTARERAGAGARRDRPGRSPQPPSGRRLPDKPRVRFRSAAAAAPAAPPFPGAAAAAGEGPGLRGGARRGEPQPRVGSGSEQPRTARRSPAGPRTKSRRRGRRRCCPPAPRWGPAAAAPPASAAPGSAPPLPPARRRAPTPSPAGAVATGSPGPGPRFLTLASAAVAVLAVGQVVQHGAGCPRPHAAARELRAPRSAASRVPAPPPAAAGRGLQCGGARALGSVLPAEPSPAAHFITYAGGIAPAAVGRGAAAGGGREAERTPPPGGVRRGEELGHGSAAGPAGAGGTAPHRAPH